jgi:uncharacterized OB-fold protein
MKIAAARVWRYNRKRREYLGKVGKVIAWSVVRSGPEGMERRTPYVVGIIECDGERLMGQIVEVIPEEMKKGLKVKGVLRRLYDVDLDAIVVYGVKWRRV